MATKGTVLDYDAVVVGAGAAGIAATGALHVAGLRVVCVEAADRIGGRAHTDPRSSVFPSTWGRIGCTTNM